MVKGEQKPLGDRFQSINFPSEQGDTSTFDGITIDTILSFQSINFPSEQGDIESQNRDLKVGFQSINFPSEQGVPPF